MNDNPFETEIRYRLAQVTSEKTKEGADAYRAVTSHDPIDMMDLAKRGDSELATHVSVTRPTLAINWNLKRSAWRLERAGDVPGGARSRTSALLPASGSEKS